jgi:ribosomal protein L37AE/L43A
MRKKTCPSCQTVSYGSSDSPWICPKCKNDISNVPSVKADVNKLDVTDFLSKVSVFNDFCLGY